MRRGPALRVVAVAVTLLVYTLLSVATYRALRLLWTARPDPLTTVVVVASLTLVAGYASYRIGTARLRYALGAVELPRGEMPALYRRVDALADRVGVETPRLMIAPLHGPNALAIGGARDGDVVLDGSLFHLLTAAELEAIIAHELAHLKGRDSLVKTLGYSVVRTVTGLVWLLVLPAALLVGGAVRAAAVLRDDDSVRFRRSVRAADATMTSLVVVCLFFLTAVVQAYSRHREYAADDRAARLTGPLALASALEKIDRATMPAGLLSTLVVNGDEEGPVTELLASHPPMDDRIERLRRRAEER
jgi:heat shock protein HtpX